MYMTREQIWQWMNTPNTRKGLGAAGDDSDGIDWEKWIKTLPGDLANAWKAYTTAELQSQLLQLNIQRAANNQPLIKMPGISVGADSTTLLVIGGVGILIAVALSRAGKRR